MADVKELNINSTTYNIKAKSVVDQNTGSLKFWSGTYSKYIGLRAYYDFYYANMGSSIYTTSATPQVGDTIYQIVIDASGNRTATSLGVLVAVGQEGVYYQNGSLWVYTGVTPIEYPRNSGGDLANLINSSTIYNVTDTGEIFKGTDSLVSSKVSKSGDTMTGALTISTNDVPLLCKNTNYTFGTNPSSDTYTAVLQGLDTNGSSMMGVSNTYMSNGAHYARIYSTKDTSDNDWATLDLGFNQNGDRIARINSQVFINANNANQLHLVTNNYGFIIRNDNTNTYFLLTNNNDAWGSYNSLRPFYINNSTGTPYFANTPCVDGQWVQTAQTICSDQSLTSSSDSDLPKTVTLPNDGHNYEVAIRASCTTGSTSGNLISVMVHGNVIGAQGFMVCTARTRTNSTMTSSGTVIIPMKYGSNNLSIIRRSSYVGTCDVVAVAYRRIGTNS